MSQRTIQQMSKVSLLDSYTLKSKGLQNSSNETLKSGLQQSLSLTPIETITNVGLQSCLYVVREAAKQCQRRKERQGFVEFYMKECFVDQNFQVVIIQDTISNKQSFGKKSEMNTMKEIVQFVNKRSYPSCFDDFLKYFERVFSTRQCTAIQTISVVQTYSECSRTKIEDRIISYGHHQYQNRSKKICSLISRQRMSQISEISSSVKRGTKSCRISSKSKSKLFASNQLKSVKFGSQILSSQYIQSKTKQSSASTAYKSSLGSQAPSSSTTFGNTFGGSMCDPYKIKVNNSLFPVPLQQIASQSQYTDLQQSKKSRLSLKNAQLQKESQSTIILKQNQQRILSLNNWEKKMSKLIKESNMKQSYTVQVQGQKQRQNLNQFTSALLGKLARVVVKSQLPVQSVMI